MVLKDRQPCGRLLLLIIQSQQVSFRLLDFILHFLSELLSGLDLLPLFCDHVKFEFLLFIGQLSFNLQQTTFQTFLPLNIVLKPRDMLLLPQDLAVELINLLGIFTLDVLDLHPMSLCQISYLLVQIFIL